MNQEGKKPLGSEHVSSIVVLRATFTKATSAPVPACIQTVDLIHSVAIQTYQSKHEIMARCHAYQRFV